MSNLLLGSLGPDRRLIEEHIEEVTLKPGEVLHESGSPIQHLYFPHHGLITKLTVFEDGTEVGSALVGRSGFVGMDTFLGLGTALTRAWCPQAVVASRIKASRFHEASRCSPGIADTVARYLSYRATVALRNGACHACHPLAQRLCRVLLTCARALESPDIWMPQDLLSKTLGVQRSSVNPLLQRLRAAGVIALGRGRVTILQPARLKRLTCECDEVLRNLHRRTMGPVLAAA